MRFILLSALCLVSACGGAAPHADTPKDESTDSENGPSDTALGTASAAEATTSDTTELSVKPPSKGTSALESRNIKMDFELTLLRNDSPAGLQSGLWSVEEQRSMQVRETGKNAIELLSIVYGKRIAQPLLGIEKKPVTAGNKYLVKAAPGGAAVTTLEGGKVDVEQRDAVLSEFGYVGAPSLLLKVIASKPAKGKKTQLTPRQALALLGEVPGLNIDKTEISLEFIRIQDDARKTATFKANVQSEIVSGPTRFGFKMEGPAHIDVETGWVSSIDLKGTIKPSGQVKTKKGMFDVQGKGRIEIARSTTF